MTPRRALWGLIVVSGLLRLAWAASLGPGNDEAYHYLFTLHRDWSYFDHPPMLAWVGSVGVALTGGLFGLRLGFVSLFAGSTWLMARLTARFYGERAGVLAAFALNVAAYYTAAAGAFALPDGPLLFFWLLTLDRLALAVEAPKDGRPANWRWLAVGLAWGGALLSKYHAVFLPAGTLLYLAVEPTARHWLRRPGPYLAVVVGLLVFSPVIGWNAAHDWVSFAFQGSRALGVSARFRPETLLAALILPALYLFPWVWWRLVRSLIAKGRGAFRAGAAPAERFLLTQSVLPVATFLAVACTRPVLPHWTLVGFLPLFPMAGEAWARAMESDPPRFRRRLAVYAAFPVLAAMVAVFQADTGFFQKGRPGGLGVVSAAHDPTADMVGWDTLAAELRRRGLLDRPDSFLFTSSWYQSGQIAFATRGSRTPVLCYHAWDARSFAFWSRPEAWLGRDGILVEIGDQANDPLRFRRWFRRIEPLGGFEVRRGGAAVRTVRLYRCVEQTVAFPFDDLGRTIRPIHPPRERRLAAGASGEVQ